MRASSRSVLQTYIVLTLLATFASSFIWGVNTLFLLDAGLSITQAFAANSFYAVGQVLFEVPTGVVADTWGRRASYMLGAFTLFAATVVYLLIWEMGGPFWMWAVTSAALGLGFTFFSGAVEAWLVDALQATGYKGSLDAAFAKGQIATGVAMLSGTILGGAVAQATNLGVPYIMRAAALAGTFIAAYLLMHDYGFTPKPRQTAVRDMRDTFKRSLQHGFGNPSVRWVMLAAPFTAGVGFYAFYAMQPHLLQLYGNTESYLVAGLAASIVAGAQILGGLLVAHVHRYFRRRTSFILAGILLSSVALVVIGVTGDFYVAIVFLVLWALIFAGTYPVRQAYINGLIPSEQRATVLSTDNLVGSSGGAVVQPGLGKVADVWSYGPSFVGGAIIQMLAVPFVLLARKTRAASDEIKP